MSTRKRTRQAPEKERKSNVPLKTSKTEKLAVTNTDAIGIITYLGIGFCFSENTFEILNEHCLRSVI